ncbi:MAG: hypothetical protein ACXVSU_02150 [Solirubrobacteraceae bacterium]
MDSGLDLTRDLRQAADHRVQAARQAPKVGVAVGVHGRREVAVSNRCGELRVVEHRRLQRLARGALDRGRALQLQIALFVDRLETAQRQHEACSSRHQRGGPKPDRDLADVVQRAEEENHQRQHGSHRRNGESRRLVLLHRHARVRRKPDGARNQKQRGRPRHRVQEPADVGDDDAAEQRRDVAGGVHEPGGSEQVPPRAPTGRKQLDAQDRQAEQQ